MPEETIPYPLSLLVTHLQDGPHHMAETEISFCMDGKRCRYLDGINAVLVLHTVGHNTTQSPTIVASTSATWGPTTRAVLAPRNASGTTPWSVAIRPHQAGWSPRSAGAIVDIGASIAAVAIARIGAAGDGAAYASQMAHLKRHLAEIINTVTLSRNHEAQMHSLKTMQRKTLSSKMGSQHTKTIHFRV